jgi:hypothetical protein
MQICHARPCRLYPPKPNGQVSEKVRRVGCGIVSRFIESPWCAMMRKRRHRARSFNSWRERVISCVFGLQKRRREGRQLRKCLASGIMYAAWLRSPTVVLRLPNVVLPAEDIFLMSASKGRTCRLEGQASNLSVGRDKRRRRVSID